MTKAALKRRVIEAIDSHEKKILSFGRQISHCAELGFKEFRTTEAVTDYLASLGLEDQGPVAITGNQSILNEDSCGPTIALLGELDAIIVTDHPEADSNGVVHACGHHIQLAGMLGAVTGLIESGILDQLEGRIKIMTTPAEEFIELDYRQGLRDSQKIESFSGKQEMIRRGLFDDVDISMMFHSYGELGKDVALVGPLSNGFIAKQITFRGEASHAGSAPEEGINALNAASLAMMNIHAQREVFKDTDRIRVHSIITKGGDIVNVVPAEVKMESCVRARTVEALIDANKKVNRALQAGALAVGAQVEILDEPGYLPILRTESLDSIFKDNIESLGFEGRVLDGGDFTCSFDFGDISHLMPALHPMIGGVSGALHTKDFRVSDEQLAYILPAKALALSIIDLLFDEAKRAKEIINEFKAPMTKESYLQFMAQLAKS
mgnify:CR=1 FL=1